MWCFIVSCLSLLAPLAWDSKNRLQELFNEARGSSASSRTGRSPAPGLGRGISRAQVVSGIDLCWIARYVCFFAMS